MYPSALSASPLLAMWNHAFCIFSASCESCCKRQGGKRRDASTVKLICFAARHNSNNYNVVYLCVSIKLGNLCSRDGVLSDSDSVLRNSAWVKSDEEPLRHEISVAGTGNMLVCNKNRFYTGIIRYSFCHRQDLLWPCCTQNRYEYINIS